MLCVVLGGKNEKEAVKLVQDVFKRERKALERPKSLAKDETDVGYISDMML